MTVNVPIEIDDQFTELIVQQVLKQVNENEAKDPLASELPPYPNRKQVKRVLKIGDDRLNDWIAHGLLTIPFGKKLRFDREDIRSFLDQQKV